MIYLLKYLYGFFVEFYDTHSDPRTRHLPLVATPVPIVIIIGLYLAFVLHYGPKWMEKRKPFNLKYIMRFYNAIQVIINFILLCYGIPNSYGHKDFSFQCQPCDPTNTQPWMMCLLYVSYGYYLTKFLDLLDTIFIVLRKKNSQISFLHVYHHAGMIFGVHIFITFVPGSHATMLGVINLFVHTVMYAYYFITSLLPSHSTIWWKRYITQLQLIQFGYLSLHFLQAIIYNSCHHPIIISVVGCMQNIFMFAMFFDFYYKTYLKKPKTNINENSQSIVSNNKLKIQ